MHFRTVLVQAVIFRAGLTGAAVIAQHLRVHHAHHFQESVVQRLELDQGGHDAGFRHRIHHNRTGARLCQIAGAGRLGILEEGLLGGGENFSVAADDVGRLQAAILGLGIQPVTEGLDAHMLVFIKQRGIVLQIVGDIEGVAHDAALMFLDIGLRDIDRVAERALHLA